MRLFCWILLIFIHATIGSAFGASESKELTDLFPPMSPISRQGSSHCLSSSPPTPTLSRETSDGDRVLDFIGIDFLLGTTRLTRGASDGSTAADTSNASLNVQRSPADDSQRYDPQTRYATPKVSKDPRPVFNNETTSAEGVDPYAPLVLDTSTDDSPEAFYSPLPQLKLPDFYRKHSEEEMRANISTHYFFHSLWYGNTTIGSYFYYVEQQLLSTLKSISQNMTGGVKSASTKNVCVYSTSVIDTLGNFSSLISGGFDSFGFLSPPTPSKSMGSSPDVCVCLSPSGPAFKEKGGSVNIIGDLNLQERDGFLIGIKDQFLPVIFSNSDAPSDSASDKRLSVISILNKIRAIFPTDTLTFLEEQLLFNIKDAHSKATGERVSELELKLKHLIEEIAEKKEQVEMLNDITPLVSMLSDGEISKIYGHSEQVMARYFEKIVIPALHRRHSMLKASDPDQGIAEVIFHIANLQDCCWWCARTLSALSGPKVFDDGTVINLRFLVTSFKSFPTRSIDSSGSVHFHDSREGLVSVREMVDLTTLPPILFNFSTLH